MLSIFIILLNIMSYVCIIIGIIVFGLGISIGWEEVQDEYGIKSKEWKWSRKGILGGLIVLIGGSLATYGFQGIKSNNNISTSKSKNIGCSSIIEKKQGLFVEYSNCMNEVIAQSEEEHKLVENGDEEDKSKLFTLLPDGLLLCSATLYGNNKGLGNDYESCSIGSRKLLISLDSTIGSYIECLTGLTESMPNSQENFDYVGYITKMIDCQSNFLDNAGSLLDKIDSNNIKD